MTEQNFNPFDLLSDSTARPCTFQLLSTTDTHQLLTTIQRLSPAPLVIARVVGWIIKPTSLSVDELMSTTWDLFLVHDAEQRAPDLASLGPLVKKTFAITARVPAALLDGFASRNRQLLAPSAAPPLTGALDDPSRPGFFAADSQPLKMTEALWQWFQDVGARVEGRRAVSMLNLLALDPDRVDLYRAYGSGFHDGVGVRRGGFAKLVGNVVEEVGGSGWDEVAVAHYPSLMHFADMVAGDDYQEINDRYRIPALKDTLILCTTEVVLEG